MRKKKNDNNQSIFSETHEIPLGQYIVECRKERDSPRYLRGLGRTATYDFSCIVKEEGEFVCIFFVCLMLV